MKEKSYKALAKLSLKDDKYFIQLVERYEIRLMRYILRITRVRTETAEDILQEVFLKIYKNLNEYDNDFSFSSWIYRITHNEVISYIRKKKARPQLASTITNDDEELVNLLPSDVSLPRELEKKERIKKVRECIYALPYKYREVLILRYIEDKTYAEISDILRKSVNSVSVLINRAKKKLKDKLTKEL